MIQGKRYIYICIFCGCMYAKKKDGCKSYICSGCKSNLEQTHMVIDFDKMEQEKSIF